MSNTLNLKINYKPHSKQLKFHKSNAKFRAIITGVGFGKSAAGVNEMIKEVITHPGTLNLIFAPTMPMLKSTTMQEFWKFCPREIIKDHNKSEHIIHFINDAKIIYLSGDNERHINRIRGLNLGSAYGDEVSLTLEYIWKIVIARLRDKRGSLRGWITTTPKGFNWIYDWFVDKKYGKKENYAWFGGSTFDNPYTPEEYKQTLKASYTGVFKDQELYGQFRGFEGNVYREFNREIHIGNFKEKDFKQVIAGVDWGYTNPMACSVMGIDGDGRKYIIDEIYEKRLDIDVFYDMLKSFQKKYEIDAFYADPSEPQFIEKFFRNGLNIQKADNEVMYGINQVNQHLKVKEDKKPRLYVDESCVNTIMEFENYRYPEGKEGKPTQENPIKLFDHLMDCIRYAIVKTGKEVVIDFG